MLRGGEWEQEKEAREKKLWHAIKRLRTCIIIQINLFFLRSNFHVCYISNFFSNPNVLLINLIDGYNIPTLRFSRLFVLNFFYIFFIHFLIISEGQLGFSGQVAAIKKSKSLRPVSNIKFRNFRASK